jgi:hypothetical protein
MRKNKHVRWKNLTVVGKGQNKINQGVVKSVQKLKKEKKRKYKIARKSKEKEKNVNQTLVEHLSTRQNFNDKSKRNPEQCLI